MKDELDAYLRTSLRLAGVEVADEDLPMLRMFHDAMAPRIEALMRAPVMDEPIEYDLDPSRSP
jgi:hypothetical protein